MYAAETLQPPPVATKARLSVRTTAQFLDLPAVEQIKLLRAHKFAGSAPHVFKPPYYRSALSAIQDALSGNNASARARIERVPQATQRMHCMRVLEGFMRSAHASRGLRPAPVSRYYLDLGGIELKLSPDLHAYEGYEERFIYFNTKKEPFNPEAARKTLELAHWLLEENGVKIKPQQLEFLDLCNGILYEGRKRRQRTIKLAQENARLIESLWPGVEP